MNRLSWQIKQIEVKEKKGSYGKWRKDFCRQYRESLNRIRSNTQKAFVETLASKDKAITCRKGCTYCCFHYVTVSLAHGIIIVDYLYKKKDLLKQFFDNYEIWHSRGHSISNSIDQKRIQAISSSQSIDRVIADTRPLSTGYLDMNIRCPFLSDSECYIYDVRPLSCSGHYSVSPPNWCEADSYEKPIIYNLVPNDEDLSEMIRLTDPRLILYELTLPTMIYKLLTEGSSQVMKEVVQYNLA